MPIDFPKRAVAATALIIAIGSGSLAASQGKVISGKYEPAPGEGVICAMGIYNALAEYGRRCSPPPNPEFQAELERSTIRIDQFVLANSKISLDEIAKFKLKQSRVGAPDASICRMDIGNMYQIASKVGAKDLRDGMDKLLARPGEPTWGDCL
jgi:hypothetical protein